MEEYQIKIVESILLVVLLVGAVKIFKSFIDKVGLKFSYNNTRTIILKKLVSVVAYVIFTGIILLIWGIPTSKVVGYIASLFTVVGIAFIAQWSLLSNITSTLVIYFNRQIRIGDTIAILDKDFNIKGTIHNIGIFFIIIEMEGSEFVSIPSNVFMQKMIKKIEVNDD